MALLYFSMLINELLNKDTDIVPQESPIIILDSKSAVFMDKDGKGTKHTSYISRRVNFVSYGENFRMHKIDWCEGGLQLADIATKNVDQNDLNTIIKYFMVRLEN